MINAANINQSAINKLGYNVSQPTFANNMTQQNGVQTSQYTYNIYPQSTVDVYPKTPAQMPKITHTSWFYINDVHGKMTNMERIYNISKEFDKTPDEQISPNYWSTTKDKISKFKVSSGDIILGANYTNNKVANQFLNWSGFIASALGNHELDVVSPTSLAKLLENANYKTLAVNIDINENSPLKGRIEKSIIIEKDGEKYGLIGVAPSDMKERVKLNDTLKDITVANVDKTIALVQAEVQKLKSQNINKIIVLSHSGIKNDKRIATETEGIDLIFGAHTHELLNGLKEGENLLYSKSGEPVIITQAGKDGENVGILNVDFDENGIIKKAQNNIIRTRDYNRPLAIKHSVEMILGKPEVIGRVSKTVPAPAQRLIQNNPHGNLIADAMRHELGTDIALLNAGNIRGSFSKGPIDTRLISDITPFENKMLICSLSEKQIVDAIKFGCKSVTKSSNKPGILIVSGLRYKFDSKGELLDLEFIDRNNDIQKININNPSPTKKYTVAADDFFATGGDGYMESNKNPDFIVQRFDIDKNKLTCDYIKKLDQPIEIIDDKRVQSVE